MRGSSPSICETSGLVLSGSHPTRTINLPENNVFIILQENVKRYFMKQGCCYGEFRRYETLYIQLKRTALHCENLKQSAF